MLVKVVEKARRYGISSERGTDRCGVGDSSHSGIMDNQMIRHYQVQFISFNIVQMASIVSGVSYFTESY